MLICKVFIFDQVWCICEMVIQVYGGFGYIDVSFVEQNVCDVKILLIWEGMNYIQVQDFVCDKFGFGCYLWLIQYYCDEFDVFFVQQYYIVMYVELWLLFDVLCVGVDCIVVVFDDIVCDVQDGYMYCSSQFYMCFLEMFGVVMLVWVLFELVMIVVCWFDVLEMVDVLVEFVFYCGKLKSVCYYFVNVLFVVDQYVVVIVVMVYVVISVSSDEFVVVE